MRMTATLLSLALALSGSVAFAGDSPCCAVVLGKRIHEGKRCDPLADSLVSGKIAGCLELDPGTCIGGGPASSDDLLGQLIFAGCICLGGTCVSDSSAADTLFADEDDVRADDDICTRDAAFGCCENDACSGPETE